jgi:AraC-like DNA-binding protein
MTTTPLAHHQPSVLYHGHPFISILEHRFATHHRALHQSEPRPGNIFFCLNLEGRLRVQAGESATWLGLRTLAISANARTIVRTDESNIVHHFLTIEISKDFWAESLEPRLPITAIRSLMRTFLQNELEDGVPLIWKESMPIAVQNLCWALIEPAISNRLALPLWYEAKIYELVTLILLEPEALGQTHQDASHREQIIARKRVETARAILDRDYVNPPSLEMLASEIGCGAYSLSRLFSREMGMTIPQYLREIRLERAEKLLRSGRYNVTQTAFAVGYQSLSHFSKAFWERFGCCPGLYGNPKLVDQVGGWTGREPKAILASRQSAKLRAA